MILNLLRYFMAEKLSCSFNDLKPVKILHGIHKQIAKKQLF